MGEAETHGGKRKTREKKAVFITINIDRTLEAIAVICTISLGVQGKRKDFGGWFFLVVFLLLLFSVCFLVFTLQCSVQLLPWADKS